MILLAQVESISQTGVSESVPHPGIVDRSIVDRTSSILLLITNDIDPYYRDAVNVLAQPRGSRYWFRYLSEHAPSKPKLDWSSVDKLSGVILFRDHLNGALYPIRGFTDAKVEKLGDDAAVIVIDFCVGDFPEKPSRFFGTSSKLAPGLNKLLEDSQKAAESQKESGKEDWTDMPLIKPIEDKGKAIRRALIGNPSKSVSDDEIRWVETIKKIKDLDYMQWSCFLYLRYVEDQHGRTLRRSRKRGFCVAKAGTYHVAKVTQYCPANTQLVKKSSNTEPEALTETFEIGMSADPGQTKRSPNAEPDALIQSLQIEMTADHDQIRILEGKYTLEGRYDGCELTFKTETDAAGTSTVIRIAQSDISPSSSTDAPAHQTRNAFVPTITMDMEIDHATWQWSMLFVGVLFLLGGFVLNVWVPAPIDQIVPDIYQKAKTFQLFTLMTAIGATLTTWLGKDFWASLFRRQFWLWRGMTFLGHNLRFIIGTALVLTGWQMLNDHYLSEMEQILHPVSQSISNWFHVHTTWLAWTLIGGGAILIGWKIVNLVRAKRYVIWEK